MFTVKWSWQWLSILWDCPPCLVVEVLLYIHRNRRVIRDGSPGRPPRLSYSSSTLLFLSGKPLLLYCTLLLHLFFSCLLTFVGVKCSKDMKNCLKGFSGKFVHISGMHKSAIFTGIVARNARNQSFLWGFAFFTCTSCKKHGCRGGWRLNMGGGGGVTNQCQKEVV